jgi:HSP20 family molecular chaperone IbpA
MKVDEKNRDSYEQLKKVDNELKMKIIQRENELKSIEDLYNRKNEDQEKIGEEAYQAKIENNNNKLLNASKDMEEKLIGYSQRLEKTKNDLSNEEKRLKDSQIVQAQSLKSQFDENITDIYDNAKNNQESIQYSTQNELKNIAENARYDKLKVENQFQKEVNSLSSAYSNKFVDTERDFRTKLSEDVKNHQEQVILQNNQFKKDLDDTTAKNKRLGEEKSRVQNDELQFLEKYHQNLMEQKTNDFKVRYKHITDEHEQILANIKAKLDSEVNKIQLSTMQTKKNIETKSQDPFYRIEKLEPKLVEQEKSYLVSLNVPEYEKEDVHFVAHGRNLKVTLSKKFQDIVEDEDKSINRSSKTQLYSKEFNVADLVNPKNIQAKYENNVLTFKIDKL